MPPSNDDPPAKRARVQDQMTLYDSKDKQIVVADNTPERTSDLLAPTMLLTGHGAAIYTLEFDPSGQHLASGSFDRKIFLWDVFGECTNYMVLEGHKNAVLELHWNTDGNQIVSCSADKVVSVWDAEVGQRVKKLTGHTGIVNSCSIARRGPPLIASGSDDGAVKLWDARVKRCLDTFPNKYQVTAVCFSDATDQIFSGGLDNDIKIWDMRKLEVVTVLEGHQDTITGLSLSPDGSYLLSNSMDNSLCKWDVRAFCEGSRCTGVFKGSQHNAEKLLLSCSWSPDGSKVTAGSSDRMCNIWNVRSQQILYHLPGHHGSLNDSVFHPKQPIVGTCSSDKQIFLGEIQK